MKARIVITTFNSTESLIRCIHALESQTRKDFEVFIVNNDPTDTLLKNITLPNSHFHILNASKNTGFAGGSNYGAKGAITEWIITLNPDAFPKKDWFEELMRASEAMPSFDMLSTTLISEQSHNILDGAGDVYSIFGICWRGGQGSSTHCLPNNDYPVLAPCGAAAAYRRNTFNQNSDLFDSDFFCYLEDIDLGLRLQLRGIRCLHVTNAIAYHIGGVSTGADKSFQYYYTYRNQVRLIIKNTPIYLLLIVLIFYIFSTAWIVLRTTNQPNWKSRINGINDGWKALPNHLRVRKNIQNTRTISTIEFAKLLTWSPKKVRHKALKILNHK